MDNDVTSRPTLTEKEIFDMMKIMRKKTKSSVPGNIPPKLRTSCQEELAKPVTKMFNNIIKSDIWPKNWKLEFGTPLTKIGRIV